MSGASIWPRGLGGGGGGCGTAGRCLARLGGTEGRTEIRRLQPAQTDDVQIQRIAVGQDPGRALSPSATWPFTSASHQATSG